MGSKGQSASQTLCQCSKLAFVFIQNMIIYLGRFRERTVYLSPPQAAQAYLHARAFLSQLSQVSVICIKPHD